MLYNPVAVRRGVCVCVCVCVRVCVCVCCKTARCLIFMDFHHNVSAASLLVSRSVCLLVGQLVQHFDPD